MLRGVSSQSGGGGGGGVTTLNTLSGAVNITSTGATITITNVGNNINIEGTGSGTTSFSGLTTGTNTTAAMTVGSGASLLASGTGTIAATTSAKLTTGRTISTTGDITYTSGSFDGTANVTGTATLATVNANVGTFGSATQVSQVTLNAKGLATAANNVSIQIAESQVTNLVSDLASKQATGNYITALTGDITATGPGSVAATLATVNANVGTFGSATQVPQITFDGKGRATAASNVSIQIAESQVTNLVSDLAGKQGTLTLTTTGTSGAATLISNTLNIPQYSGGGGGSPGGSNTQVQYNNAGAFGGAANTTIDGSGNTNLATYSNSVPSTPSSGVTIYGGLETGKPVAASLDIAGREFFPAFSIGKANIISIRANAASTTPLGINSSSADWGPTGTATVPTYGSGSLYSSSLKIENLVTVASTTAVAGFRNTLSGFRWFVGTGNWGGFHLMQRGGPCTGVATATSRLFMGMRGNTAAPTDVNPSTLINILGFGYDSADTNIQFMYNAGAGTASKINTGIARPTSDRTSVYDVGIYVPTGGTIVYFGIKDLISGTIFTGNVNTNIPASTTALIPMSYSSVGGTSSVVGYQYSFVYIDMDT